MTKEQRRKFSNGIVPTSSRKVKLNSKKKRLCRRFCHINIIEVKKKDLLLVSEK
jgi:hypothetical protein